MDTAIHTYSCSFPKITKLQSSQSEEEYCTQLLVTLNTQIKI